MPEATETDPFGGCCNCFSSVVAHDDPRIVEDLGAGIAVWNVACTARVIVGWKTRAQRVRNRVTIRSCVRDRITRIHGHE